MYSNGEKLRPKISEALISEASGTKWHWKIYSFKVILVPSAPVSNIRMRVFTRYNAPQTRRCGK